MRWLRLAMLVTFWPIFLNTIAWAVWLLHQGRWAPATLMAALALCLYIQYCGLKDKA